MKCDFWSQNNFASEYNFGLCRFNIILISCTTQLDVFVIFYNNVP
jgi:hypothetical protein